MSMMEDKENYTRTDAACPNCGEITEAGIALKSDLLELRGKPYYTFNRNISCPKCGHNLTVMLAVQDLHHGKQNA